MSWPRHAACDTYKNLFQPNFTQYFSVKTTGQMDTQNATKEKKGHWMVNFYVVLFPKEKWGR